MEQLQKLLQEILNEDLLQMVLSGKKKRNLSDAADLCGEKRISEEIQDSTERNVLVGQVENTSAVVNNETRIEKLANSIGKGPEAGHLAERAARIKVRPVKIRGGLVFQAAFWDGKKEYHKNYQKADLIQDAVLWMRTEFKQLQADTTTAGISVLVSKKGKVTIKQREIQQKRQAATLTHNRKKRYILEEGIPVPFLVELGVMTLEGKVINSRYDKFRQINRFLEFIEDICPYLPKGRELTMIDFGCGKSYLTFAMYYYLRELRGMDLRIIGLDLKEDVIDHCNALAKKFGYEKLQFLVGDIADYEGVDQVDLVVTLHACDTATDYALAKAVA